jgi:predicted HicB family RNase H-like nuclease
MPGVKKTNKRIMITIRRSDEEKIKQEAKERRMSVSQLVNFLLRQRDII